MSTKLPKDGVYIETNDTETLEDYLKLCDSKIKECTNLQGVVLEEAEKVHRIEVLFNCKETLIQLYTNETGISLQDSCKKIINTQYYPETFIRTLKVIVEMNKAMDYVYWAFERGYKSECPGS